MLAQGAGMPPQALRRVLRDRLAETPGGAIVAQSAGAMIGLAILTPAPLDEAVSFIEPQPAGDAACLFFRVLVIDAFAGKRSPAVAASLVAQARTLARRLGLPALSAVTTSHGHEVYLQAGFVKRPTQSASVAAALARLGPGAGYYVSGMANGRCPPQELHPTLRQGTSPRRTVVLGKR
jgi:hypothetical protein